MARQRGVNLTQIHPPPGADTETDIDIIAIHGLDTKSPDTWVWKSKSPDENVNWLACPHMLPERVGSARIFMCDWPADLYEQPDLIQKTAKVFARLLLAGIKRRPMPNTRHAKKKDRPIVFIASCLGGIILMKALLIASHPPNEYTAIRQSTRGIVFLATPFRGTSFQDVASWAEPGLRAWALIRRRKVNTLLGTVKGSTLHLEELVRKFTQLCQDETYPCQVHTFYELGMTILHRKVPLSSWLPSSLLDLVCQPKPLVDSSSATLDIVKNPLPLDRSHIMMNKFQGPEDPGYICVVGKIEEILQDIRTNSLLDDADAWIRNKHYTADNLKIERLSGDLLPMDQCYINLAIVEQLAQDKAKPKLKDETPSPFSLFHRQKLETPDDSMQVELAAIFNQREGPNGSTIQPRRILIRGRAGVGKTTLCKKIVHEFIQGTWSEWNNLFDRVLWVPLRNLKLEERRQQAGYNFEQLFTHEYFSLPNNKPDFARELAQALELETTSSRTLFLLDGLDEVSQDLSEGSMSNFLNELLKQPNIIVTSRPSGKLPSDLDLELETIGFYPAQVKDYIKIVFTDPKTAQIDEETVDKVQSFVQNHWLIQGLVRIPIQLDALCYSWEDIDSDMPETMTALYQAIELSLWRKDMLRLKKTHGQNPVTLDHIQDASRQKIEEFVKDEISFLESLAFTGLYNDVIEFETKYLNRISDPIPGFLPAKTIPCLSFLRASNLSAEFRNRSYHFIHLTFQEYFAARYFVRQWLAGEPLNCVELGRRKEIEPIEFLQKHKYTARYDILWRFVAGLLDTGREGMSANIEEFFQKIEEEPLDLLGPTHQRLIMHCLSEVSSNLPFRTGLEQQLSKWLLFECEFYASDPHHYLLNEREVPEQALDAAFRAGSDDMKRKIIRSINKRVAIPAIFIEWATSWIACEDRDVRYNAIWALRQQSSLPDKILKVLVILLEDHDGFVRELVVTTLGNQSALPSTALGAVATRIKDENNLVRAAAATILQRLPAFPVEVLNILKDAVAQLKNEDEDSRKVGIMGLRLGMVFPEEISKDLTVLLKDKNWFVREAAIRALNTQPKLPHNNLEDVAARLKDENESVQVAAIMALGNQPALPNNTLEDVAARLKDEDESVQMAAIEALCRQPALPNNILEDVAARLKDENESIQVAAIRALGKQSALPNNILKTIAAQLENKYTSVREAAIRTLAYKSVVSNEILQNIILRLEDEDEEVQVAALEALGKQPALPNNLLKDIAAHLDDKYPRVREAAIYALRPQSPLSNEILQNIILRVLLRRSFKEQLTWYIDNGHSCIDMPEGCANNGPFQCYLWTSVS
ncbi:uncharacterized protein TRIVIDRAFT_192935 [Trichoderma virens Gv29-8]|uniref:NACHT domain-containing protein n=1 Tax=Hypocrea virens (strain Gv29-8 / FGSC 10586) TaxID=413071 RepID=G9MZ30_HYPVG|nr:uncharacterized protein TRIVIDRAFT_192935 [Trichoderma virens Gv29-8]EHK20358.1 hypothetical protein TRIVIDRAFT_192935 [Trichoderma virens Gv29-8]